MIFVCLFPLCLYPNKFEISAFFIVCIQIHAMQTHNITNDIRVSILKLFLARANRKYLCVVIIVVMNCFSLISRKKKKLKFTLVCTIYEFRITKIKFILKELRHPLAFIWFMRTNFTLLFRWGESCKIIAILIIYILIALLH